MSAPRVYQIAAWGDLLVARRSDGKLFALSDASAAWRELPPVPGCEVAPKPETVAPKTAEPVPLTGIAAEVAAALLHISTDAPVTREHLAIAVLGTAQDAYKKEYGKPMPALMADETMKSIMETLRNASRPRKTISKGVTRIWPAQLERFIYQPSPQSQPMYRLPPEAAIEAAAAEDISYPSEPHNVPDEAADLAVILS